MKNRYQDFEKLVKDIHRIENSMGLIEWDMEIMMPPKASITRAEQLSTLAGIHHKLITSDELTALITELENEKDLDEHQRANIRLMKRTTTRARKIPESLSRRLKEVTALAHNIWVEARKKADFSSYAEILDKIIRLKKEETNLVGYAEHRYDALLDDHEQGMTLSQLKKIFDPLKEKQISLIDKISKSKVKIDDTKILSDYPEEKQKKLCKEVAELMGFDFEAGRLDVSAHPFCSCITNDVRLTTRYDNCNFTSSLLSVIHEAGHGLYEQGMPLQYAFTPVATGASHAIHESQSQLMENMMGRSLSFWKYLYPKVQQYFPNLNKIPLEEFYRIINRVKKNLIRVDADELTYNLHIILRMEIEAAIFADEIEMKDLPQIWNEMIFKYLGIKPKDDAEGVLQDMHWSFGGFGYFPSYTLGNIYAAQFFAKAKDDIPNLDDEFSKGNISPLGQWLKKNIHQKGSLYQPADLVKKVTGKEISSDDYLNYLEKKYSKIYNL
ncbi:MAG: carboxypeptidase M32 [Pseudomonadota bacterium]